MSNDTDPPGKRVPDSTLFLDLARLSQDAFNERRRHEWRVNLSLWAALGLAVYAVLKEGIRVFDKPWEGWLFGAVVIGVHVIYMIMVNRGHMIDKKWKHYYLAKAEGREPREVPQFSHSSKLVHVLWAIPQIVLTAAIVVLAVTLLIGVPVGNYEETEAQPPQPVSKQAEE